MEKEEEEEASRVNKPSSCEREILGSAIFERGGERERERKRERRSTIRILITTHNIHTHSTVYFIPHRVVIMQLLHLLSHSSGHSAPSINKGDAPSAVPLSRGNPLSVTCAYLGNHSLPPSPLPPSSFPLTIHVLNHPMPVRVTRLLHNKVHSVLTTHNSPSE